jgi:hypothetical protein
VTQVQDARWFFKCGNCGAFKVCDLRTQPDGRVEHFRQEYRGSRIATLDRSETTVATESRCPCGHVATASALNGRLKVGSVCDERCTHATGPDCECRCGGEKHGLAHRGTAWKISFIADHHKQTVEATPEAVADVLRRKAAAREAREQEKRQAKLDRIARTRRQFESEHSAEVAWLAANHEGSDFRTDLQRALDHDGFLTSRQLAAIVSDMSRDAARKRARSSAPPMTVAPVGKQAVEGVIVAAREKPGFRGGSEWGLTIRLDDGNRVWIKAPRAIEDAAWELYGTDAGTGLEGASYMEVIKGRRISFSGTFAAAKGDSHFSFGSYVRDARLVEEGS